MRSTTTTPCWSSQSGERFECVENFREWRRQHPAQLAFHTRRITHRDDLVVGENLISYDGAPEKYSVSLLEFRGEKSRMSARPDQAAKSDQIHRQLNSALAQSAMRSGRSSGIQWLQPSVTSRVKSAPWDSSSSSTATGM
jgi:hypothetical protein